jgi:alpha-mannosidase
MKVTPILNAGEKALRYCIEVEWNEVTGQDSAPLLVFRVPHSGKVGEYLCDVPAGAVHRQPRNQDIPCLRYCAAVHEDGSVLALMPDSKYGYRATKDALSLSLINTSNNPDPFPDRGLHTVNLALVIGRDDPKELEDTAGFLNHPAYFCSNNAHGGSLPMTDSFLELDSSSTVLSAVLPTKDAGTICVRYYETAGRDDAISLHFGKPPVRAVSTDLMGHEVDSDVSIDGKTVSVTARANAIGQLRITF